MPVRRYKRKPRKKVIRKRYHKRPLMRIGRGLRQSTFAMTKQYTEALIGSGASYLDYSNNVSLSKVDNFTNLSGVFNEYRINFVVVTVQSPYAGSPLLQIRYKPRRLSNEIVATSANMWGEIRHKKRLFNVRTGNTVSCGFKPHTWARQEIVPASSYMRDRQIVGAWYKCPENTTSNMQYSGIIFQLSNLDGSNISSSDVFQVTTKLYLQFKGKSVPHT